MPAKSCGRRATWFRPISLGMGGSRSATAPSSLTWRKSIAARHCATSASIAMRATWRRGAAPIEADSIGRLAPVEVDRLAANDLRRLGQKEDDDPADLDRQDVPAELRGDHAGENLIAAGARLARHPVGDVAQHRGRDAAGTDRI